MQEAIIGKDKSRGWYSCVLLFGLKFFLLAVDPLPKLFLGDSGSYIWTALTGWIPPDRSYLYGYVIRCSSLWTESLTPLLVLQTLASTATALIVFRISRCIFELPTMVSWLLCFVCALDPLQLVWERYILTETLALCLYASALERSLVYLKHRQIRDLLLVQLIFVFLIGFRMSYLLVVQISTVLLPLIGFLAKPRTATDEHVLKSPRRQPMIHVIVSVFAMLVLHTGYKQITGFLSQREPAYLYSSGFHLLAAWAPALKPENATDPRLAELIGRGADFQIKDMSLRNAQHYAPGFLVERWHELEPDDKKANDIAKQTALRALRRDPVAIAVIAAKTFGEYWHIRTIKRYARHDLGHVNPTDEQIAMLATRFHWTVPPDIIHTRSLLKRYFLAAWPYYLVVVLSPLWALIAIWFVADKKYPLLLFLHSSIMVGTTLLFAEAPSIRYLQPVSFVTILVIGLFVGGTRSPSGKATQI